LIAVATLAQRYVGEKAESEELSRTNAPPDAIVRYIFQAWIGAAKTPSLHLPRHFAASSNMIENLLACAIRAPSADNSQPWRFQWDGRELAISHRAGRGPDPFGAGGHAVLLAIGHVIANVTEFLDAAGLPYALDWPQAPERGQPYVTVKLAAAPERRAAPSDLPSSSRHTNRFPYARTPVPDDAKAMIASATLDGARFVAVDSPVSRSALAGVVECCSAARFCTRELHEWLAASLRFSPEAVAEGDGLDVETLHLPPGGAAFLKATLNWSAMERLNRLGAHRLLAASDSAPLRKAPLLACLVGPTDPRSVIAAGRLLGRVWNGLNARGLAVHPYYAVTDQQVRLDADRVPAAWRDAVARRLSELPSLLGLAEGERLHLILRVGWPKVSKPPRSRRLPLERVFGR
jgi:nitroreductase